MGESALGSLLALLVCLALQVDLAEPRAVMINCEPRFAIATAPTITSLDQLSARRPPDSGNDFLRHVTIASRDNRAPRKVGRRSLQEVNSGLVSQEHNDSSLADLAKQQPSVEPQSGDSRALDGGASTGSELTTAIASTKSFQELELEREMQQQKLKNLQHKFMHGRALDNQTFNILLLIYSVFIIFGTVSNSLICLTVSRPRPLASCPASKLN